MTQHTIKWQNYNLKIQTGKIAQQADGAVLVSYADTVILATAIIGKAPEKSIDFIPLSVDYIEKYYAAQRIPGGYGKREGKPQDHEVLIARLIDRSLRPLIPYGFQNEIQIIVTVLAFDTRVGTSIASIIGASAALMLSGIPFKGPLAIARVISSHNHFLMHAQPEDFKQADLKLYVACTQSKIVMVEGWAKETSNAKILKAIKYGYETCQPVIDLLNKIKKQAKRSTKIFKILKYNQECLALMAKKKKLIAQQFFKTTRKERTMGLERVKELLINELSPQFDTATIKRTLVQFKAELMGQHFIKNGKRIDGRKSDEIRKIEIQVKVLPNVHGSALFTRGETQALVTLTIGSLDESKRKEDLSGFSSESFLFHYNFPPFCVGEADKLSPPSRREIGHGYIAWCALKPVLPEDNPYVLRMVSEILACNGSSSMASISGASLSLMQAGIQIKRPVAGIAVGALRYQNKEAILVDIIEDEDSLGIMDLKVAGTQKGITVIQMDVKTIGVSMATFERALSKAKNGYLKVLEKMNTIIPRVSKHMPINVPRAEIIYVTPDKIYELIGKTGKIIKEIIHTTKCKIDVNRDTGKVSLTSRTWKNIYAAKKMIRKMIQDPEIDTTYDAISCNTDKHGTYVRFARNLKGFIENKKIREGSQIQVQLKSIDRKGNILLKTVASPVAKK